MRITTLLIAAAVPLVASCSPAPVTAIAAHNAGHGTAEIYDASFEEAWRAAHIALRWNDAGTPKDHPERRFMITNDPSSAGPSFIDQVGVWFQPISPTRTRVSVVVMTGQQSIAGIVGNDEQGVQESIAKALDYVKSGEPVPWNKP